MEIHELNASTMGSPAYVALDNGTDTYRVDLNSLITTIEGDISTNTSDITALEAKPRIWYATTSTAAATRTKVLTTDFAGDKDGDYLAVLFTNGNTYNAAHLFFSFELNGTSYTGDVDFGIAANQDYLVPPRSLLLFRITVEEGAQTPVWTYKLVNSRYSEATTSRAGLMSAEDKAKLDDIENGDGVPTSVRQALYTLLNNAAYITTGLTDELAIVESWATEVTAITLNQSAISISGAGTYQLVATTTPTGGTVTWVSSDVSVATVDSTGLVTSVGNGTATITASCGDLSATCTATISGFATLTGITATYTQSGTVYDTASLSDLVSDLVVVANYDDSSTVTLTSSQYTLSGTLAEGTSTITVTYGGFTDTFDVTVTEYVSSEVLSTFTSGCTVNYETYENASTSNTWVTESTIQATSITFTWDTEENATPKIALFQYDSNGVPYKHTNLNRYASNPVTDGSSFVGNWVDAGSAAFKFTAIGNGSITVTLPTTGIVKVALAHTGSGGTEVSSNATFGTWLDNGGLTITALI